MGSCIRALILVHLWVLLIIEVIFPFVHQVDAFVPDYIILSAIMMVNIHQVIAIVAFYLDMILVILFVAVSFQVVKIELNIVDVASIAIFMRTLFVTIVLMEVLLLIIR